MKIKLTLLFVLFCFTIQAQKQIQPYTLTNNEKTIRIYASAKTANDIKFILKNDKDEVLKLKKDDKIVDNEFSVSPFTEIVFRSKLIEAIINIYEEKVENEKENLKDILGKNLKDNDKREITKEIRNIYQFFNALIITAFQYDTEPVAGTLKYNLDVKVSKEPDQKISKLIKDLSRKRLWQFFDFNIIKKDTLIHPKKDTIIFLKTRPKQYTNRDIIKLKKVDTIYKKIEKDSFLDYLFENQDKIIEYGFEERKAVRRFASVLYLDNFELENQKILKKIYHEYEITNVIEDSLFLSYIVNKKEYYSNVERIDTINKYQKKLSEEKKEILNKINSLDSDNKSQNNLSLKKISDLRQTYFLQRLKLDEDFIKYKDSSDEKKLDIKNKIDSLNNKYIKQRDEITDQIKQIDNDFIKKISPLNNKKFKNDSLQKLIDIKELDSLNKNVKNIKNTIIEILPQIISNNNHFTFWSFKIEDIQIDFNDGFIEHINVLGKIDKPYITFIDFVKTSDTINKILKEKYLKTKDFSPISIRNLKRIIEDFFEEDLLKESNKLFVDKELKFVNQFPIGFSSKSDFSDLYGYDLVHVEAGKPIFKLPVSEVITVYNQRLQNDRLDFSPKSQVLNITSSNSNANINNEIELKKEQSSKILSARIYSDFLGFKESNPNGLIQAEIEKEIPLWTKRFPSPFFGVNANKGFFNYVKLNLTFSRIEDREQNLQVSYADEFVNNVYKPKKYVTYLDLVRRENTSVGLDANIFSFDFTSPKLRLEINAGIHFARVRAIDSLKSETNTDLPKTNFFNKSVNTLRYYPDFILRVRPEERFGGFVRFRPFRILTPREEEFFSVSSRNAFLENREIKEAWLHRIEMSLFYKPNPKGDNKFFFRYRNTNVSTWETNGFGEFQVGYHAYLKF